ncbi:MAG: methyl-accepting chemotaxis protein [Salinirussus sp.]
MATSLGTLVPDRIRESYALKFRIIAALVLVSVLLLGSLTFVQTQGELQQSTETRLETTAAAQAANLGGWVDGLRRQAALLAESSVVENGSPAAVSAYLRRTLSEGAVDASVLAIHYVDTGGPVVRASSSEAFVGVNPQNEGAPWAQGGVDLGGRDVLVSEAFPGPKVDQPVIAVIAPVEARENRAVVMMVNVGARAERLPAQGEKQFTRVVNADGTIMMSSRPDEILAQNSGPAEEPAVESGAVARGLEGRSGFFQRTLDGRTVVMGYAPVEGVDWVVTARMPRATAFTVQRLVTRNVGLLFGVTVLGFVLIGLLISRPTARALRNLDETATAIAGGDVSAEIPASNRIDELGAVQSAFAETKAYISTVTNQLEAIADQEFDAAVLDEPVPGPLGTAIDGTRSDLESSIEQLEATRDDAMEAQRDAERMASKLDQQATEFQAVMADAAGGDLTCRLDTDVDIESMRAIAESTNEMLAELETTVGAVRSFAREVDESAEAICGSVEEIETSSGQVAETTQAIATGAEKQDERIQATFGEMNELSATVEEIASQSREVADQSSQAAELGSEGCRQATAAAERIADTADRVDRVAREVGQLEDEMDRIGETVVLIDDIAEQTNMLALNANIEAARAGDGSGNDGFGVVADEIKSLSEETSSRTEEIERIIADLQQSTAELAEEMRDARQAMLDGATEVDETRELFEEVIDMVEAANDGIHAIDEATDQQATATEEVVAMVDEVSEISTRTVADTDDVAAAAEQQTASIASVTDRIDALADRAERLRELTADFTLGTDAAGSGPAR